MFCTPIFERLAPTEDNVVIDEVRHTVTLLSTP